MASSKIWVERVSYTHTRLLLMLAALPFTLDYVHGAVVYIYYTHIFTSARRMWIYAEDNTHGAPRKTRDARREANRKTLPNVYDDYGGCMGCTDCRCTGWQTGYMAHNIRRCDGFYGRNGPDHTAEHTIGRHRQHQVHHTAQNTAENGKTVRLVHPKLSN